MEILQWEVALPVKQALPSNERVNVVLMHEKQVSELCECVKQFAPAVMAIQEVLSALR